MLRAVVRRVLPRPLRLRLRRPFPHLARLTAQPKPSTYEEKLRREGAYWGKQGQGQQEPRTLAWLEHPLIRSLYMSKRCIAGTDWPDWLKLYFAGPAGHVVELGSGTGHNGRHLLASGRPGD